MVRKRILNPQSIFNLTHLLDSFQQAGIKESHIPKLYRHVIRNPDASWTDLPGLPKHAAELVGRNYAALTSKVVQSQTSASGDTTKLLIRLQDGMQVEAVIMHYDTTGKGEQEQDGSLTGNRRATLCVSSQVGCQLGCTFCATGTMGLRGNLTAGEIVEQLIHARRYTPIRNVVFMGMGEPMNNYEAVKAAVLMMTDQGYFALRRSAVTISTVGVIPRILQMPDDLPGVSLALSLHAPTQALRQSIVPSAAAYKLDRLMAAIQEYQTRTQQRVFVEYVVLAGVNDTAACAHETGALLQGLPQVVLNLIPWNPIMSPAIAFRAPGEANVAAFKEIVQKQYGIPVTVRQEKGSDISGACGQLVVEQQKSCSSAVSNDIEDLHELTVSVP